MTAAFAVALLVVVLLVRVVVRQRSLMAVQRAALVEAHAEVRRLSGRSS